MTELKEIPRMQDLRIRDQSILGEFPQNDSEIQVQFNESQLGCRQVLRPSHPRATPIMVLVQIVRL